MLTKFDPTALKAFRLAKGLTQAAAGTAAGFGDKCPGQTWAAYERGTIPTPRRETLIRMALALALGVDVGRIKGDPTPPPPAPEPVATMDELRAAYETGYAAGEVAGRKEHLGMKEKLAAMRDRFRLLGYSDV